MIKRLLLVLVVLTILGCAHPRSLHQDIVSKVLAQDELVKIDATSANVSMLLKAAESGNADAQNSLGVLYLSGNGVPADHEKALSWAEKAAVQGHVQAQLRLGEIALLELSKTPRYMTFRPIIAQAHGIRMYGSPVTTTSPKYSDKKEEAKKWFSKAADQGNLYAQMRLREPILRD